MITNPQAKTILCFGDSNTWGRQPDQPGRFAVDVRWTGILQKTLGSDTYVIEEGLNSRTTDLDYANKPGRNGKTYLAPCLATHRPLDIVILMLGTNDLKVEFGRSTHEIAAACKSLVQIIKKDTVEDDREPAEVILVSPIVIHEKAAGYSQYDRSSVEKSQQLATELKLIAEETGCSFVDASEVATVGSDAIHLDQTSHQALGERLAEEVAGLV